MKKILIFNLIIFILILCSCYENKIADIENITWKCEYLDITATSEQLHHPSFEDHEINEVYSTLFINNEMYYCKLFTAYNDFDISIYNEVDNTLKYFYNTNHFDIAYLGFLTGYVSYPQKIRNKQYKYTFVVTLYKYGQYYDYCIDNSIDFPETITFYGYDNK